MFRRYLVWIAFGCEIFQRKRNEAFYASVSSALVFSFDFCFLYFIHADFLKRNSLNSLKRLLSMTKNGVLQTLGNFENTRVAASFPLKLTRLTPTLFLF